MAGYHTVAQGEHVPGIAEDYGFTDYLVIWNHANNAQLKQLRQNPNVLFPGDKLYIPDRTPKEYGRSTDQRWKFKVKKKPLRLRLVLRDEYEHPIANTACLLRLEDKQKNVTTDGDGKIELDLPPSAKQATLVIQGEQETPYFGMTIPLKIGHLDPVDTVSGQQGRLYNLGYYWGELNGEDSVEWRSAIEEFQCEHQLTVDGICGPVTQAKLKEVHGC